MALNPSPDHVTLDINGEPKQFWLLDVLIHHDPARLKDEELEDLTRKLTSMAFKDPHAQHFMNGVMIAEAEVGRRETNRQFARSLAVSRKANMLAAIALLIAIFPGTVETVLGLLPAERVSVFVGGAVGVALTSIFYFFFIWVNED